MLNVELVDSAVGKAVANHEAEVRRSNPSMDAGKEPDREIFAPMSDALYSGELPHVKYNLYILFFLRFNPLMSCCMPSPRQVLRAGLPAGHLHCLPSRRPLQTDPRVPHGGAP